MAERPFPHSPSELVAGRTSPFRDAKAQGLVP